MVVVVVLFMQAALEAEAVVLVDTELVRSQLQLPQLLWEAAVQVGRKAETDKTAQMEALAFSALFHPQAGAVALVCFWV